MDRLDHTYPIDEQEPRPLPRQRNPTRGRATARPERCSRHGSALPGTWHSPIYPQAIASHLNRLAAHRPRTETCVTQWRPQRLWPWTPFAADRRSRREMRGAGGLERGGLLRIARPTRRQISA
jgi:hypothetical protein